MPTLECLKTRLVTPDTPTAAKSGIMGGHNDPVAVGGQNNAGKVAPRPKALTEATLS